MPKPKILVTTAAGKTGFAVATQLLEKGFPVRAMVRVDDYRSEKLRKLGAEIYIGNLNDIRDVREALQGVQRAYYCLPFSRDALDDSVNFAIAAQDKNLEMVTVLSQWLADPSSPSLHTRQVWQTTQLFMQILNVPSVTVNPGFFADNYRAAGLDAVAQTGRFTMPLGEGLNAPPSNEDIARVAVGTLINPEPHIGKTYRPTGPRLLSPYDIADIYSKVLGRKVTYQDAPMWLIPKVLRVAKVDDFQIAQLLTYLDDYKQNAFAIGAPTSAVLEVGGREPEDFETIARRYFASTPNTQRSLGGLARVKLTLARAMLTLGLNVESYSRQKNLAQIKNANFAISSSEWLENHAKATDQAKFLVPTTI